MPGDGIREHETPWPAMGVAATVLGILAAFVIPEGRCFVGLDQCSVEPVAPTSVSMTSPDVASEAEALAGGQTASSSPMEGLARLHQHVYSGSYAGQVWINIVPEVEGQYHDVHIVWGKWEYREVFLVGESLSLILEKTKSDEVPMDVRIEPAARVEFGEGAPPGVDVRNIEKGWTER